MFDTLLEYGLAFLVKHEDMTEIVSAILLRMYIDAFKNPYDLITCDVLSNITHSYIIIRISMLP